MIDTDLWFHMKARQVITETGKCMASDVRLIFFLPVTDAWLP
jgi:hypothetical protein